MWASIRRRGVGLVLALGGTVLGGCQSSGPSGWAELALVRPDHGGRVSDRQAADVQVALGRTYEKHGRPDLAVAAYTDAVKRDPKRTDAYVRLAILNDREGKFKESAELYRKALQTSPGNADIFCDMGYSMYLQRRWAEAEMNLRQALALKPDHARAHNNLGLVLAHTDRAEEALAQFRKAGTEAEAHLNLAFALTLDQHWDEARAQYELALAANPSLEQAKNGLRELDNLVAKTSRPKPPAVVAVQARDQCEPPAQITQAAKIEPESPRPAPQEAAGQAQPPALDFLPEMPAAEAAPVEESRPALSQAQHLFRIPTPEP